MTHHVAQDIEDEFQVRARHFAVVDGQLPVGGSVQAAAHAIDDLRNLPGGRPAFRSLETEVFRHMGKACLIRLLIARAGTKIDAYADGAGGRHGRRQHAQSVGEGG